MTTEQKAKAYDEAIERANDILKGYDPKEGSKATVNYIFPQLKESEDEKIRREITELVMQPTWKTEKEFHRRKELVAWLEKQKGKDALINELGEYKVKYTQEVLGSWLEKQGEQKEYTFKSIPRLLDMIEPSDRAKAYCQKLIDTLAKEGYNTDVKIVEEVLKGWNGEDVPMAVMDEKQGQKPAWGEEDEEMIQALNACIDTAIKSGMNYYISFDSKSILIEKVKNWLKSIKDRVQPQNNIVTDKELAQAKKEAYNEALDKIEYHSGEPTFDDGWNAAIWYLKKINGRPQNGWKPSDVQMQLLKEACDEHWEPDGLDPLYMLYENLKKLKEDCIDTVEVKESDETAEAFARIIRAHLVGIDSDVQYEFEQLYKEITGKKMYQGYKD